MRADPEKAGVGAGEERERRRRGQPEHALSRSESRHSRLAREDAGGRMDVEEEGQQVGSPSEPKTTVYFSPDDPENPVHWPMRKKMYIVITGILLVFNSTISSSLPSNEMSYITPRFHVANEEQQVLPQSMFLIGYVFGPLAFGPLSEAFGRKVIILWTFVVFIAFTLGCALARNWVSLLVFRLLCGINASVPITVIGGLYADIFPDPRTRGRAMAVFMASTTYGPLLGPIISGFLAPVSWRWAFWVALIFAGVCLIPVIFMPETFGPVILKRRAQRLRKETGHENIVSPLELESKGFKQTAVLTLTRPLRMLCFEAIVMFSCLYLALVYALFYLFFEAYPIIFQGIYGFNNGLTGLTFLPIGVGASLSCGMFLYYDAMLAKAKKAQKRWALSEEYRRLPVACIGGPFCVVGLFWLGWTAKPSIHWIVPMLSGLPFGFGYLTIFIALLNYLTDAYEIFAASAMAAASTSRSILGALLPLAGRPLYTRLGVSWASSLLGFISLAMVVIPFAFIHFGDKIRARSEFCQYLQQRKQSMAEEERARERAAREEAEQTKTVRA